MKNKKETKNKVNNKKKNKIPKTVQQSIPYLYVYPDDGIIETSQGIYTKQYYLSDINYQIAKIQEQEDMFNKYGELLNSFDSNVKIQICINNKNINEESFRDETLLKEQGDSLDKYRREYNEMLIKKISEGKNQTKREKYLTVSVPAKSYDAACSIFSKLDGEIESNIKRIGDAESHPLSTENRLEILHDIYNLGCEGDFGAKVNNRGKEVIGFSYENMARQGLTTKDCIAPKSLSFSRKHMEIGDKYARALYLKNLPTYLSDVFLSELTDNEFNMITSINLENVPQDRALKIIRNQMININANMIDKQKKASKSGYSPDLISPELKKSQEEANELLQDLVSRNQKMFLMTFTCVIFADTLEELDRYTDIIQTVGRKFLCTMEVLNYQQEAAFNSSLPLANNTLSVKRTLTTESTAVFMPFVSQELQHAKGFYYGLNAVSHNLILFDRKTQKNCNGFILGTPGAGKSFSAKREMLNVLLNTNDDVIVIDPEREYGPMADMLGGSIVRIATGSKYHINPLDMDADYADEDNPITLKADFLLSVCEVVLGGRYGLTPVQKSIIDRCCHLVYKDYVSTFDEQKHKFDDRKIPTLLDFQNVLEAQPEREAREIAIALEQYTRGSADIFAHKTNVDLDNRFIVYDIHDVSNNIKTLAMLVVLDNVWNRIIENRKKGRRTWFYIDEIYLLFNNEVSANFLKQLFKRARKWGGVPTGITQNVEDLLLSDTARSMISNCEFIQMLSQSTIDRQELEALLNISPSQSSYITNRNPGEGLLFVGKALVPFVDKFPKNNELYKAMTSKPDEISDKFK